MCSTSIVFTGDIGFDRYMQGRWEDGSLLSDEILNFCRSADHVCANVEGAMTDAADDGSRGVFFHAMNPAARRVLDDIHADIWNISNNHIMDAGRDGLISTRKYALLSGAQTIGAGLNETEASEPVYIDGAGGIGILGTAYMTECIPATETEPGVLRWNDMELIKRRIDEIRARCRYCVVVAHGGEEFAALPNPYTRERYTEYLRMGADAVVAHHPHVPENYERFEDGKLIFYSLGNFIFDTDYQRAHPYTDSGVLLKLIFGENGIDFEAIGTRILRGEEKITASPLPDIFTDVNAENYKKLAPLNAKAFITEERRKMIYLEPEKYKNAGEGVWHDYFFGTDTDGYCKGEHMDLSLIVPLAESMDKAAVESCPLEGVKNYIMKQM